MEDIDHEYTDEIVCPWCGYKYSDSWEFSDDGEEECPECEKNFSYNINTRVTYNTERKKCKEGKCEYEIDETKITNPYIYKYKDKDLNWTIYKCKICDDEIIKTGEVAADNKPYIIPLIDSKSDGK